MAPRARRRLLGNETVKVAVIADRGHVQKFARDALDAIEGCDEITFFSCNNTRTKKKPLRHGFYYALNLVTVRNAWARAVPVASTRKRIAEAVEFDSGYEGAWQVLPDEIVDRLQAGGFDVIIKFGMGLLRVPPPERLSVPMLSYHHGDPDRYRGRPAGFWEMMERAPVVGQIVQIIGNRLDAGQVVAFGETKVHRHSYRATLVESFRHSPLIINAAIRNALSGTGLAKPCTGRNYRLPSNWQVVKFVAAMAAQALRRLFYGAFYEKKWRVSLAPAPAAPLDGLAAGALFPPDQRWRTIEAAKDYSFYADPFFSEEPDGILVEGLRRSNGKGEILLVRGEEHRLLSQGGGHYSYPAAIILGGRQYVVPEVASWSPPIRYMIGKSGLEPLGPLALEPSATVTDPTLVEHEGRIYLFGNIRSTGAGALYLWSAESVGGTFRLHPLSPVLVSPRGARMAGSFLPVDGRLIRFGQDFRFGYGDGVFAYEVEELSETAYRERPFGGVRLAGRSGPHTLNFREGEMLFDWYRDAFSLGAGYRRVLQKLRARLPRR